jgi:hypothetical protein
MLLLLRRAAWWKVVSLRIVLRRSVLWKVLRRRSMRKGSLRLVVLKCRRLRRIVRQWSDRRVFLTRRGLLVLCSRHCGGHVCRHELAKSGQWSNVNATVVSR